jgi:hypothetical protein
MYVLPNRSKKHSEYFKRFGEQEKENKTRDRVA